MAEKTHRISKVAAQLNVSWRSLIEELSAAGFDVEAKPTAKIGQDMYDVLERKFRSDKQAKEESLALEIHIKREDETLVAERKSSVPKKKKDSSSDILLIKDTGLSMSLHEEETATVDANKEVTKEAKVEETPVSEPVEETPVKEKKVEEVVEKVKTPEKKDLPGLKVLGKIDLSKKKEEKKKEEKVEEPVAEIVKEPEAKVVEPKSEEKIVAPEATLTLDDVKTVEGEPIIKPQYEKLGGLTIKGKIKLPEPPVKRKKPVASSEGKPDENLRKKRKRKSKPGDSTPAGGRPQSRRGKDEAKEEISEKEIQDKIKATLAKLGGQKGGGRGSNARQKLRKQRRDDHKVTREEEQAQKEIESKILKVTEFVTANELSVLMSVSINDIITACFSLGMMVSINQRLDAETIQIVAEEFGFTVQFVDAEEQVEFEEEEDDPDTLEERWPIVTVMGHVDHGKTSLLDHVRNANVIAGEAGGITQHVAAYEVQLKNDKKITFVDTPGHEAFTAMRARGAKVTDIAIIVIAADDNVMPQTKEAISHAQAAGVPIVFAFNKIDRDNANPDRIREELSAMDILVEEWGGKFQAQEISAKKGTNIDDLLDKVLLEAELLELKANADKRAKGTVMEAQLDKGRGVLASLLVQEGTLKVGDALVAGQHFCRVRAMFNERMQAVKEAGPSTPVNILGFTSAPTAGDVYQVFESEQDAKEIANRRAQLQREQGIRATKHITLDEIGRRLAVGNFKELKVIVKADVDGSAEALSDALIKLGTEEIQVNVIHKSVGQITESDVLLASASDAIIIGFQVRPAASAKKLAESEEIDIRLYSIIYQAIDEIKSAMEGMLAPEYEEKITGNAEIREVFKITKVGTVAGCMVTDGKIFRDNLIRLIREGVVVYSGQMASLKRFKDDMKEVNRGFECGIQIKNYNDLRIGDIIECYTNIEIKRKLK
jgi:translation initiation factor IF-2